MSRKSKKSIPSKRDLKSGKGNAAARAKRSKSIRSAGVVALALVGIIVLGIAVTQVAQATGETPPWTLSDKISVAQARQQISSGAIVVDVRSLEEYVAGHIDQSLSLPLDQFSAHLNALPHDRLLIMVCQTGARSVQAYHILQDAGFTQITVLSGGIEAWKAANYPVVTGEPVY
jgi:rhodanese-related sulfurtransferase